MLFVKYDNGYSVLVGLAWKVARKAVIDEV